MDEFWNNDDDEPDWFEKDDVNDDDDPNGDNTNGDDGDVDNGNSSGTHHILILIDCDPVMFTPTTGSVATSDDTKTEEATAKTTYMNECMTAIQSVIRNKIRTVTIYKAGKRDGIGVIFYNTKYRTPILQLTVEDNTATTKGNNRDDDNDKEEDADEEEDEDDDDDRLLFGLQHGSSSSNPETNVHEFVPLEPPGVSTMERIKSTLLQVLAPSQTSSSSSSAPRIDLEKEYCPITDNETTNDDNDDDAPSSMSQLPPLLHALRKAMMVYSNASCVKKTRKTSAGKWEEPDSKHVWIITPRDDPYSSPHRTTTTTVASTSSSSAVDRNEMIRVLQECVNDMKENDLQLHVWPICVPSSLGTMGDPVEIPTFDRSIFYNSITSHNNSNSTTMTSTDWVNSLDAVYKKTRPAYRVPFLLPNWKQKYQQVEIAGNSKSQQQRHVLYLDMYNVHQIQKEPSVVPIHQSTGKLLGKVRQLLTVDDGGGHVIAEQRSFDPKSKNTTSAVSSNVNRQRQLRTYFEFGNEFVPFSLRDKISIKKKCNTNSEFASLILLGFKPAASIPFYHTIEKSYFAYPSESSHRATNNSSSSSTSSNSIDAIAHLHGAMIRQNVIGIGELLTRATATSRLVVIRPIQEVLRPVSGNDNEDNDEEEEAEEVYMLVRPPGLLISALPFEDEMRMAATSQNGTDVASEEMINATMHLIETQTFPDDVEVGVDFTNAAMSRFWNYVEHIAYNDDTMMNDTQQQYDTEINTEKVLERSGEQIDQLVSKLPEAVLPEKIPSMGGRKRKTTTSSSDKKPSADDDGSGLDWYTIVQEGKLSKCTVADLKSKLRSIGEPVNGNKSVLVERLESYFASSHPIKLESDVAVKVEDNCI